MNSEELLEDSSSEAQDYFILAKVNDYTKQNNRLYLTLEQGQIVLEFITAGIIRVVMIPQGEEVDLGTSPAITEHNLSYNDFIVQDRELNLHVRTDDLELIIDKQQFALNIYDGGGNLIHQDYSTGAVGWRKEEVRAWKVLEPEERFYGLGEKTGWLDKRGREYVMWNHDTFDPHVSDTDPLYQSIPFLVGFKQGQAYGIYFDNTYKSDFDLGATSQEYYSFGAEGGQLDYYFIKGPSIKDVVTRYTELTGTMPLPPKWALGYHQSRHSYYPASELRELASEFRDREIPCDALHLDIKYMDQYQIFTWDHNKFPNPQKLLTELNEEGFKPVTIVDPGVKQDPEYELYQQGIAQDYFCKYLTGEVYIDQVWPGDCAFPDFTQAEVRDWWGDLHQDFLEQGVRGIWNDMNEPAVFNETDTMDLDVVHANDGDPGTHRRFHNLYGLLEDQATYEGLKRNLDNERPFVLTRAGFAGVQRYSAVWTGDNRSFWDHIKLAMPMVLNLGLSGVTFAGTDVGGFTGDSNGELVARWTQLGAFLPFFRNHCEIRADRQEPWVFAGEYEEIIKDYIQLRYKLLTHLYNLFYQASQTGIPVLRPLVMEYPTDQETYNLSDQFMVGESMLVAPIYQPDRAKRMVYLPEGNWYDFWTGQEYTGEQYIIADAPLDTLPLYIKAGSILPFNQVMNYVGETEVDTIQLSFYLHPEINEGSYQLYDDDGISFDYQTGNYNLTEVDYNYDSNSLEIEITQQQQGYPEGCSNYCLQLNHLQSKPSQVVVDKEIVTNWEYDANQLELLIPVETNQVQVELG